MLVCHDARLRGCACVAHRLALGTLFFWRFSLDIADLHFDACHSLEHRSPPGVSFEVSPPLLQRTQVGYVIPTPVVQHFLTDYKRSGGFSGFPALGLQWQRMESDALRRSFLLGPKQKGGRTAASWEDIPFGYGKYAGVQGWDKTARDTACGDAVYFV